MNTYNRHTVALCLAAISLLALCGLILALCAAFPAFSAFMRAAGIYSASVLAVAFSFSPVPVAEALLVAGPLAAVALLVLLVIRRGAAGLWRGLAALLCAAAVLGMLFTLQLGVHYTGPTLAAQLGIRARGYTKQDLFQTAQTIVTLANEYAPLVPRDSAGAALFADYDATAAAVMRGYGALARQYDVFTRGGITTPKRSLLLSQAMSRLGIAGVYVPFTAESLVNMDTLPSQVAFTLAHEAAHAFGVGREGDANFAAFLSCVQSSDPVLRYSAMFNAYIYTSNALWSADPELGAQLSAQAGELLRADLARWSAHVRQYDGPVKDAGSKINDGYIKATGQPEGERSYGLVVDLLIAYYLEDGRA